MQHLACKDSQAGTKSSNCNAGWLLGSSNKKKVKTKLRATYVSPADMTQQLKEGRAVDLAALLELKQLVHHSAETFFSTWVEGGNPCKFAKVT